jgi:hypothetical protein
MLTVRVHVDIASSSAIYSGHMMRGAVIRDGCGYARGEGTALDSLVSRLGAAATSEMDWLSRAS